MPAEDVRNSEVKEHWGKEEMEKAKEKAGNQERIRAALCQAGEGMKLVHKKDLASRTQLR